MQIIGGLYNVGRKVIQAVSTPFVRGAKGLKTDVVDIATSNFSPLERKLMDEVRAYTQESGKETARIINRNGKQLDIRTEETQISVRTCTKNTLAFDSKHKLKSIVSIAKGINETFKCSFVHSHTADTPISSQDVMSMLTVGMKKMVAITPNGGISSMEIPSIRGLIKHREAPTLETKRISKLLDKKAKELGVLKIDILEGTVDPNSLDPEKLKQYSAYAVGLWQEFANKFGLKFEHNMDI